MEEKSGIVDWINSVFPALGAFLGRVFGVGSKSEKEEADEEHPEHIVASPGGEEGEEGTKTPGTKPTTGDGGEPAERDPEGEEVAEEVKKGKRGFKRARAEKQPDKPAAAAEEPPEPEKPKKKKQEEEHPPPRKAFGAERDTVESVLAAVDKLDSECQFDQALLLLETHPTMIKMKIRTTKLLVKLERDREAQQILFDTLKKEQDNVEILLALGFFFASMGESKEAEKRFRKALRLSDEGDPNWKRAKRGLNLSYLSFDKGHAGYWALKAKSACWASSPKRRFFYQGKAAHYRGWHAEAKGCYEQAMLNGGYKDDSVRWAFCCVAGGSFNEALEFFRKQPGKFEQVVLLIEEMEKVNDGYCPYRVLMIRIGSNRRDIMCGFDRRMKTVENMIEEMRVRKAFLFLTDYELKMEYDALHLELDSLLHK